MNTERTTKTITLEQSGATVELYDYITGRDKRAIEAVYLEAAEVTSRRNTGAKEGEVEIGGVKGTATHFMQNAAFKAVIKSVTPKDGEAITDSKKVLDFILDAVPEADYDQIVAAVNEVTDPKKA